MTFSQSLKKELVTIPVKYNEMLAEMLAFLHFSSKLYYTDKRKEIVFETKLPMVALRFLKTLNALYPEHNKDVKRIESNFKINSVIKIKIKENVDKIINELGLTNNYYEKNEELLKDDETKKAYIRASFLVKGSINNPMKPEYHMEIFSVESKNIIHIQKLFVYFSFNAKIIKRRNGYIVYLKEAEKISDIIKLMGSTNILFEYENYRIQRDNYNSLNRIINCELHNMNLASYNGLKQIEKIKKLELLYPTLKMPIELKNLFNLRIENPEASLQELSYLYNDKYNISLSKSKIYRYFKKLDKMLEVE